jgi:hypothetical protein
MTAPFIVMLERNAVEQDFHILDAINRNTSLANIPDNARMVAVIAPVGCEIESDRKALLPSGQIAAVKCIGFLSSRETRILADRPWAARIHRRTHTARKWRKAGKAGIARVFGGIQRLYGNALRRVPG